MIFRRTSYTNREMTELEGALSEIVETAKKISRTEKTSMVLQVDLKDLREIEEALECTICKGDFFINLIWVYGQF